MKIKVFFQHSVKLPVVVDCEDSASKMDYLTIESQSKNYELTLQEIKNYFAKLYVFPVGFYQYGFMDSFEIATYPYKTIDELNEAVKLYKDRYLLESKKECSFKAFYNDGKIVVQPFID